MSDVKSCLLVGVGGQGAILISKIMSNGFMKAGYDVKQSEVHGMAQRGGSVSTQVRWGKKVYGPVFGKGEADIMVALEKMEAVRYAEFLNPDGVAVINDYAIKSTTIASGAEAYPEGCIEAFANIYRNFARTVMAKRDGREPEASWLDFPGVDDGIRGMQFIETVVRSGYEQNVKWIKWIE